MPKEAPKLVPLDTLYTRARFHETGTFRALYYRSLPLFVPGSDGLEVAYFYGPVAHVEATEEVPAHLRLGVPTHLATLEAETGRFRELRVVARAEVGVAVDADPWLGPLPDPPEDFGARRTRLVALLDELAPVWAVGDPAVPWAAREKAEELLALFEGALEPPLVGCYRAVGVAFLQWAARIVADAGAPS